MDSEETRIAQKRLERLMNKLSCLKSMDKDYDIFGADTHEYKLGKVLEREVISDFEKMHHIILPYEYKLFLLEAGNGGAGPFYGIVPFESCLFADIDYPSEKCLINPSLPFLYTDEWNMDFMGDYENDAEREVFENEYFDDKHINGMIRICNFGCGHFINLVVNGKEHSHIWSDDRASDCGIYPFNYYSSQKGERLTFFDWYEKWLDQSIDEVNEK